MNVTAPTRPTELRGYRVRLSTVPAAAAQARRLVREAIRAWDIPVDPEVAKLLTSELVTNAIRHETGETVKLAITCSCGQLRVDVHDTSRSLPVLIDAPADAETGRGLMLVASLSTDWGLYRTPAGKAVYFTLAFQPDLAQSGERGPQGFSRGDVSITPRRLTVPTERTCDSHVRSPPLPRRDHLDAMVRRAASRAMSVREWTSSFFRMCETWVATVRRESNSRAAISGLDSPSSTNAAILISVGVRLSQPLRACRCLACGPRRMPWARNAACSRATSAAAPSEA